MDLVLIAAMTVHRVIGRHNQIPWHIAGEQTRFKETTWGHSIIMGRKTHESIGRALPGRRNIVITRNCNYQAPDCELVYSPEAGLAACSGEQRVFVIGGEQIFKLTLERANTLILTVIERNIEGDAYFPDFSPAQFQLIHTERVEASIPYTIQTLRRK